MKYLSLLIFVSWIGDDCPDRPITYRMDNDSSKASRALKWTQKGNKERADRAIDRALEFFVFTIE